MATTSFKPDFALDVIWLSRISYRLEKFKRTSSSSHVYACRCVSCGDSRSKPNKLSLYFYTKKNALNFECKRCGYSGSFWRFMVEQCSADFEEYKREQLKERIEAFRTRYTSSNNKPTSSHQEEKQIDSTRGKSVLEGVTPLSELSRSHPAVQYIESRGLGHCISKGDTRLLYSDNFKITAQSINPEPLNDSFPQDARIVIPFYSQDGERIEMLQGRSLDPDSVMRYITIKADPDVDKIFGKNLIDRSKTSYCVEGPFDSLFIDNCLAACDANLARSDADVLIWDNEPRSINIIKYMERAIDSGRSIVVWPTRPDYKQDINDMILMGITKEDLMEVIKARTYSGLMAKLELMKWRKV